MPRLRDTEFEGGSKNKRRDQGEEIASYSGRNKTAETLGLRPFCVDYNRWKDVSDECEWE